MGRWVFFIGILFYSFCFGGDHHHQERPWIVNKDTKDTICSEWLSETKHSAWAHRHKITSIEELLPSATPEYKRHLTQHQQNLKSVYVFCKEEWKQKVGNEMDSKCEITPGIEVLFLLNKQFSFDRNSLLECQNALREFYKKIKDEGINIDSTEAKDPIDKASFSCCLKETGEDKKKCRNEVKGFLEDIQKPIKNLERNTTENCNHFVQNAKMICETGQGNGSKGGFWKDLGSTLGTQTLPYLSQLARVQYAGDVQRMCQIDNINMALNPFMNHQQDVCSRAVETCEDRCRKKISHNNKCNKHDICNKAENLHEECTEMMDFYEEFFQKNIENSIENELKPLIGYNSRGIRQNVTPRINMKEPETLPQQICRYASYFNYMTQEEQRDYARHQISNHCRNVGVSAHHLGNENSNQPDLPPRGNPISGPGNFVSKPVGRDDIGEGPGSYVDVGDDVGDFDGPAGAVPDSGDWVHPTDSSSGSGNLTASGLGGGPGGEKSEDSPPHYGGGKKQRESWITNLELRKRKDKKRGPGWGRGLAGRKLSKRAKIDLDKYKKRGLGSKNGRTIFDQLTNRFSLYCREEKNSCKS